MMMKEVITKTLGAVASVLLTIGAVSCNVHQWPDDKAEEQITLRLVFDTSWTDSEYEYDLTRAQVEEGQMQYTIRAYPVINGNTSRDTYVERVFKRNVTDNYDCVAQIDLAPGEYHLLVWSDFVVDGKTYYNTEDFQSIKVNAEPYTGDTDYRDAFRGALNIKVDNPYTHSNVQLNYTVEMSRPLARYEFIASDLEEFIEKQASNTKRANINLDDYYVVVSYPQFMPSAYNMFTFKPSDSLAGISFTSTIEPCEDGDALLGFDYVFVNGSESDVTVQLAVYSKETNQAVARTPFISVPLMRGVNTIVTGKFLESGSGTGPSDGVGINPGFDGDINIFFSKKRRDDSQL